MRVAFYAPLKPPSHPVASGDRRVARLLLAAIRRSGSKVFTASKLRAFDAAGDQRRQRLIRSRGEAIARRLPLSPLPPPCSRRSRADKF